MAERTTMVCPHCDGTGKGPQSGYWGAVLTTYGRLPAECQNCLGAGVIEVDSPATASAPKRSSEQRTNTPETPPSEHEQRPCEWCGKPTATSGESERLCENCQAERRFGDVLRDADLSKEQNR